MSDHGRRCIGAGELTGAALTVGGICRTAVLVRPVVIWIAVAANSVIAIESLNTGPNRGASVPALAASKFKSKFCRLPLRNASMVNGTFGNPLVSTGVSE